MADGLTSKVYVCIATYDFPDFFLDERLQQGNNLVYEVDGVQHVDALQFDGQGVLEVLHESLDQAQFYSRQMHQADL